MMAADLVQAVHWAVASDMVTARNKKRILVFIFPLLFCLNKPVFKSSPFMNSSLAFVKYSQEYEITDRNY
jgi:hypothetical protein